VSFNNVGSVSAQVNPHDLLIRKPVDAETCPDLSPPMQFSDGSKVASPHEGEGDSNPPHEAGRSALFGSLSALNSYKASPVTADPSTFVFLIPAYEPADIFRSDV
jgi:hypothetical protein